MKGNIFFWYTVKDGRIRGKWSSKIICDNVESIHMVQDRNLWRAIMNIALNLPPKLVNSLPQKRVWHTTCWCSCRWDEAVSLNCGHKGSYCSSPRWCMSMESHGEMILTRKTEELEEIPVLVPLYPPQISRQLTRARTRASAVRGRRLTVWDTERPGATMSTYNCKHIKRRRL
jgi:hypothetical protein